MHAVHRTTELVLVGVVRAHPIWYRWSDRWSRFACELRTEWGWVSVFGWADGLWRRLQNAWPPALRLAGEEWFSVMDTMS